MKRQIPALALLALLAVPAAMPARAAAPDLAGTTLCLNRDLATWPSGAGIGAVRDVKGLDARLYADLKALFGKGGVKFGEERGCADGAPRSRPKFFVTIDLGAPAPDGRRELKVSVNATVAKPGSFMDAYVYSDVAYSHVVPGEDAAAHLRARVGDQLTRFVARWRAANP